jgi:hypothetical protein
MATTAGLQVHGECRSIPTGYRSLGFGLCELSTGDADCVELPGDSPLTRHLAIADGVLVMLVDGHPCTYLGQLHPFRTSSSALALDALVASARALGKPTQGGEPAWLKEVMETASRRALGVSLGSLWSTLAVALFTPDRAWVAHVGDVVAALARPGDASELVELTEDHTLLRQFREAGTLKQGEESDKDFLDSILVNRFGALPPPDAEVREIEVDRGDVLVLVPRGLVADGVRGVSGAAPRADRAAWQRAWLDAGQARGTTRPVLLFAERT